MKRSRAFIALMLAVMCFAAPLLSSGCAMLSSGSDYCLRFLDLIAAGKYAQAYEMIDTAVQKPDDPSVTVIPDPTATPDPAAVTPTPEVTEAPLKTEAPEETPAADAGESADTTADPEETAAPTDTPAPTPAPTEAPTPTPDPTEAPTPSPTPDADGNPYVDKTISRAEFINKYKSIFEELQLKGTEYTVTDVDDGDIATIVSYTLTYHTGHETENGNDLIYDMQIQATRVENRWVIDWSPTLIFPMMDWGDAVRVGVLQANRGEILCDGIAYAQNVNIYTVYAVPSSVDAAAADEAYMRYNSREEFARIVAAIPELELTEEDVLNALGKARNDFAKLTTFYPDEVNDTLRATLSDLKGLGLDTANYGTTRYYPYGSSLAHIIGYASIITKKEQIYYETIGDTRYNGDSWVGKYGLELQYEDDLTGTNGSFTYIQDVTGASNGVLYRTDAVDGKDLHLTIIPELQERLCDIIDNVVYDQNIHGAVIVMNPKTGALQAMQSFPSFDLNYVSRGMPEEEWEAYLAQKDEHGADLMPLFNRATQGLYPPGSTFKLMTAACLIENGTLGLNDVFPQSEMKNVDIDEWIPSESLAPDFEKYSGGRALRRTASTARSGDARYVMSMQNSVITSDNLFFAYGALRLGWDTLYNYLDRIGWREAIEFELQEQVAVPQIYSEMVYINEDGTESIDYENRRRNLVLDKNGKASPQREQNVYDLAVTGYGQGQLLVSPLQMACFISAYANDGDIMVPHVLDSIWHATGTDYSLVSKTEPRVWRHAIQKSTVDTLHYSLQRVCRRGQSAPYLPNGTAYTLVEIDRGIILDVGYTLMGKTGTAEIGNDKTEELAWFICWRDTDNVDEARLCCVMLELDLENTKIPANTEIDQMKFDIVREMLKKDVLNDGLTRVSDDMLSR